ncbi:hypothetical protein KAR91_44980 [Candidatus Pacearchaeota archaeon]|nr:hypothetical protein [Candidatus Pacearchaeota archaeon]
MAITHAQPIDRKVPSTFRYQLYDGITHASAVEVDINSDLGRPAKTGYILNNDDTDAVLYLNHLKDIDGCMTGITLTAGDKFSFTVFELNVSSIKVTGSGVNIDIFVS